MENLLGLLRIRVQRGINLAVRDSLSSSDPYVVVTFGEQKLKSRVVDNNLNPEWNDALTLSVKDLDVPITLTVYDKDILTSDDKMGDAEIDIKPYVECVRGGLENQPNGFVVKKIQPSKTNCLVEESICVWEGGKIVQEMRLRLRNVECGEVVIQLEWIDLPGSEAMSTA
ncbi:protein C2-DOMAIN ABA-RELATED 7-like [Juglans microcarpa x Juglans regia]|uniref:protein C2-DOMAIN ABA-RELATED 7-like n=1 Tax=Juglans microcarpa x Juglans regia TaxID=2249226 RepID=UPI001B7E588B|nr:protein C2-DOMAIN ABA-RELATED 7-like [Juglans microcarpa x Juglans regia]XP_041015113.1 protein C2-DOMAIN ABA-RELATED 7-like [Juglans microcarpa x Juglans regia]